MAGQDHHLPPATTRQIRCKDRGESLKNFMVHTGSVSRYFYLLQVFRSPGQVPVCPLLPKKVSLDIGGFQLLEITLLYT